MSQTNLEQKVKYLERDILEIKKYLGFNILKKDTDMENWQKIKGISEKIREDIFKERYPRLYARIRKERQKSGKSIY